MAHTHTHSMEPWLNDPVMLHSSRVYNCSLNVTELCDYQTGYWRFWFKADHRYALPTTALFMTTILLFAIPYLLSPFFSSRKPRSKLTGQVLAFFRFLSYRSFRIPFLNWNSAPLGVLLLGAVGTIFFFAMTLGPRPYYWPNRRDPPLSFGMSPPIATRSGWMALACLPFIIATSSKSNLITGVTGVSHEKLQVFHRWISYACFVLALVHTFPFIVFRIWRGDMEATFRTSIYYWTGIICIIAQAWLTFASFSPLRNWSYEFFKYSHFLAALLFVVFFFLHCNFRLSSWDYFIATGVIFTLTYLHTQLRIFFQHGVKKANVSLASNGFIRIGVPTHTTWRAGQHYFIRMIGLGVHGLTSHPFTACSLPTEAHYYAAEENELVFYIRPQGGFTARLAEYTKQHPNHSMRVLLDGPYGGIDMTKLANAKKTLALAGGSGAGWLLPLIESFLRRTDCLAAGCKPDEGKMGNLCDGEGPEMRVILATRDIATRNWFEEAITDLLSASLTGCCPSGLSVEIYYTGHEAAATAAKVNQPSSVPPSNQPNPPIATAPPSHDPEKPSTDPELGLKPAPSHKQTSQPSSSSSADDYSSSEEKLHGSLLTPIDHATRPDLPRIIASEAARSGDESLAVFVCGPLDMQSDVANAVAREQLVGGMRLRGGGNGRGRDVYFHAEHFSWA